jgi:hypothetical protein
MSRLAPTHRIFILLVILLAPFVAVHVQEMIFRYRAEHLLADVRSLVVHNADLAEIHAVFKRWDPKGHPCTEDGCTLEGDSWRSSFYTDHIVDPDGAPTDWQELWLPPLFRTYGGRISHVAATVAVVRGTIRIISYEVSLETSPGQRIGDYYARNQLSGGAVSGLPFSLQDDWQGLNLHPTYVIGGVDLNPWCPTWAGSVYVGFSQNAGDADMRRLMSFDLSCLTRWRPCRKPVDLMPEAAAQHAKEEFQLAQVRNRHVCGPDIIGLMARDAWYAGIVEVKEGHTEVDIDGEKVSIPTVRMIENFRPDNDWGAGEKRDLEIYDVNTDHDVTNLPAEVHSGNRVIVLAQAGKHHRVRAELCGIVPLNPANLELVRQAIAGNLPSAKP